MGKKKRKGPQQTSRLFFEAAKTGNTKTLRWSLAHGGLSPTELLDSTGHSALHTAAAFGQVESLQVILDHLGGTTATVTGHRDKSGRTARACCGIGDGRLSASLVGPAARAPPVLSTAPVCRHPPRSPPPRRACRAAPTRSRS